MKKKILNGDCQLVYITPESLMSRKWRQMLCTSLYTQRLKAVVIDEAHCIDKWFVLSNVTRKLLELYLIGGNLLGSLFYMLGKFVASCLLRYLYCY